LIQLTYAIGEQAGQQFMVRLTSIMLVDKAKGDAGAVVQLAGGQRIAVLETVESLRQKLS
jgi:ribosomal protein L21